MSITSVTVRAKQAEAFTRLRDHLADSGTLAASTVSTVDAPHLLSYSLRLRDGTTQTTCLQLTPLVRGCLLTVSVDLEHDDQVDQSSVDWLPLTQLEKQHAVLARSFAGIAAGGA